MPENWRPLHEALFPLDSRQISALLDTSESEARDVLCRLQGEVVRTIWSRAQGLGANRDILDWLQLAEYPAAANLLMALSDSPPLAGQHDFNTIWHEGEPVGDAYERWLHPDLRHRLGEHYTPPGLVKLIIDGGIDGTVCDPSCGDGRFLVAALASGARKVAGAEVNPIAVTMARFSLWSALDYPQVVPEHPIDWADFLLRGRFMPTPGWPGAPTWTTATTFVGNPPWVLWRNLTPEYRSAVSAVFGDTHLNQVKGWGARVSAGQTDLSYLFLHEMLSLIQQSGRVALVLPRSVFKAPIAGSIVRSGEVHGGRRFAYERVYDISRAAGFEAIRSETTVGVARADLPQNYPVPWIYWNGHGTEALATASAVPSDSSNPSSPWFTDSGGRPLTLDPKVPRHNWRARGGVNTGGGNGVFHVRVLREEDGLSLIENIPSRGTPSRIESMWVESRFVRPLLKGTGVLPWRIKTDRHVVFTHSDLDPRIALSNNELNDAPGLRAYLNKFESELSSRKELVRWGVPWHSVFRVGPYTVEGYRVAWPTSSGARIRAAILPADSRVIADQKVVLVSFQGEEEAYFLAGLLNTSVIRRGIAAAGGMDASPSLLSRLQLPAFDGEQELHQMVVAQARRCAAGDAGAQEQLESLVSEFFVS